MPINSTGTLSAPNEDGKASSYTNPISSSERQGLCDLQNTWPCRSNGTGWTACIYWLEPVIASTLRNETEYLGSRRLSADPTANIVARSTSSDA